MSAKVNKLQSWIKRKSSFRKDERSSSPRNSKTPNGLNSDNHHTDQAKDKNSTSNGRDKIFESSEENSQADAVKIDYCKESSNKVLERLKDYSRFSIRKKLKKRIGLFKKPKHKVDSNEASGVKSENNNLSKYCLNFGIKGSESPYYYRSKSFGNHTRMCFSVPQEINWHKDRTTFPKSKTTFSLDRRSLQSTPCKSRSDSAPCNSPSSYSNSSHSYSYKRRSIFSSSSFSNETEKLRAWGLRFSSPEHKRNHSEDKDKDRSIEYETFNDYDNVIFLRRPESNPKSSESSSSKLAYDKDETENSFSLANNSSMHEPSINLENNTFSNSENCSTGISNSLQQEIKSSYHLGLTVAAHSENKDKTNDSKLAPIISMDDICDSSTELSCNDYDNTAKFKTKESKENVQNNFPENIEKEVKVQPNENITTQFDNIAHSLLEIRKDLKSYSSTFDKITSTPKINDITLINENKIILSEDFSPDSLEKSEICECKKETISDSVNDSYFTCANCTYPGFSIEKMENISSNDETQSGISQIETFVNDDEELSEYSQHSAELISDTINIVKEENKTLINVTNVSVNEELFDKNSSEDLKFTSPYENIEKQKGEDKLIFVSNDSFVNSVKEIDKAANLHFFGSNDNLNSVKDEENHSKDVKISSPTTITTASTQNCDTEEFLSRSPLSEKRNKKTYFYQNASNPCGSLVIKVSSPAIPYFSQQKAKKHVDDTKVDKNILGSSTQGKNEQKSFELACENKLQKSNAQINEAESIIETDRVSTNNSFEQEIISIQAKTKELTNSIFENMVEDSRENSIENYKVGDSREEVEEKHNGNLDEPLKIEEAEQKSFSCENEEFLSSSENHSKKIVENGIENRKLRNFEEKDNDDLSESFEIEETDKKKFSSEKEEFLCSSQNNSQKMVAGKSGNDDRNYYPDDLNPFGEDNEQEVTARSLRIVNGEVNKSLSQNPFEDDEENDTKNPFNEVTTEVTNEISTEKSTNPFYEDVDVLETTHKPPLPPKLTSSSQKKNKNSMIPVPIPRKSKQGFGSSISLQNVSSLGSTNGFVSGFPIPAPRTISTFGSTNTLNESTYSYNPFDDEETAEDDLHRNGLARTSLKVRASESSLTRNDFRGSLPLSRQFRRKNRKAPQPPVKLMSQESSKNSLKGTNYGTSPSNAEPIKIFQKETPSGKRFFKKTPPRPPPPKLNSFTATLRVG